MNKKIELYEEIMKIIQEKKLPFEITIEPNRSTSTLLLDYNEVDGYILYKYMNEIKCIIFSSHDSNEIKYYYFELSCQNEGFKYESHNCKYKYLNLPKCDLKRKAYTHALHLLKNIDYYYYQITIPRYEFYLNVGLENNNIFFNRYSMAFEIK